MAPLVADAPATSSRARRRRPAEVSSTSAPAASAPAGVVVVSAARLFFGWRSSARVPSSWACALGGHSDLIMVAPPRPKPTPPWAFVARHRVWTPSPNVPRPPPPPLPPLPPPSCVPLRLIGFVLARCVINRWRGVAPPQGAGALAAYIAAADLNVRPPAARVDLRSMRRWRRASRRNTRRGGVRVRWQK